MEKIHAIGRRKKSVARLFISKGKSEININKTIIIGIAMSEAITNLLFPINFPKRIFNIIFPDYS